MSIYDYEKKSRTDLNRLMNCAEISAINKYNLNKLLEAKELSPARVGIIARHLILLFKEIPDVVGTMADRDLVNRTFKKLQTTLKPGYYETVKNVSKAFVRWHNDDETPKGWKDIKGNGKKAQKRDLRPEDMVTWNDGLKLAMATNSIQLKAIILCQLDGGFRPSEFVDLNYNDIAIKDSFAIARVNEGKTGKRDVILFRCVPFLQKWLNSHPLKKKGNPLWLRENSNDKASKRYNYFAIRSRILELGRKIKLDKPLDFYNLRHSACYISKMDNVNPELAARKFGHSVKHYTETYGRLSPQDDIKRYSKLYQVNEEDEAKIEKPIRCTRCNTVNEPGLDLCDQCGNPLNMGKALSMLEEHNNLKDEIRQIREEQKDIVRQYMKELLKQHPEDLRSALAVSK